MPKRDIAGFIAHWSAACPSGRANSQAFRLELCDLLEVPAPDKHPPAGYFFEYPATEPHADGTTRTGRIERYKRTGFFLEARPCQEAPGLTCGGERQPMTRAMAQTNPDLPGLPDAVRARLRSGASADRRKPSVLIQNAALYRDAATPEAGLITTNSLRQTFARRVVQLHLNPGRDALPRVRNNPSAREAQTKVRAAPQRGTAELAVTEKLIHDPGLVSVLKQIGKCGR